MQQLGQKERRTDGGEEPTELKTNIQGKLAKRENYQDIINIIFKLHAIP